MKFNLLAFLFAIGTCHLQAENISWTPPTALSSSEFNSSNALIGIDSNGNAEAIWIENGELRSSTYLIGMEWTASTVISNTEASQPSLVVDLNGNATVAWIEGSELLVKAKNIEGSWGMAETLSASGAASPQLAVDITGNIVAVWANNGAIHSKTKLFGGSWSMSADVLAASGADSPLVSIGSNGKTVAAWHGLIGLTDTIYSSNKMINGNWSASAAISNPANRSINPHIAIDANGNALVIWYIFQQTGSVFSNVYLQSSYLPSGGSWSLPILVSSTEGYYDPTKLTAKIGFDNTGNAIVMWSTSTDGSSFNVSTTIRHTGGNGVWVSPEVNILEKNINALGFDLSTPSSINAFSAYMLSIDSTLFILSSTTNVGALVENTWSFPSFLSNGSNNGFPRIAASVTGSDIHTAAVWVQSDPNIIVQAATGIGTLLQPPTDLSVVQGVNNLGIFTEYYNTLSWTPSSSPNIIAYFIFRDGLFIGQTGGFDTSFIDNNREQNAATTYGISSVDSQGTESGVATVSFP